VARLTREKEVEDAPQNMEEMFFLERAVRRKHPSHCKKRILNSDAAKVKSLV